VIEVGALYYKAMNAAGPDQTIPAGTQVTVVRAQGDTAYVQAQG
jgi:membrane protein implicated in regulation of membrane protease activity